MMISKITELLTIYITILFVRQYAKYNTALDIGYFLTS